MIDLQHGKIITTESYYDGALTTTKKEAVVSVFSTKEQLLKDIIDALAVLNQGTHSLDISVKIDTQGRYRIIRKWAL